MASKFRSLLLVFISCAVILLWSGESGAQSPAAEQLNQEGFVFLYNGAATEALSSWQRAEELYRSENNHDGVTGTRLNQALAEQSLGLYPQACLTITQALSLPAQTCHVDQGEESVRQALSMINLTEVNRIGVRLLGENLRSLGNLAEAKSALTVLQRQPNENSTEGNRVALALGNVHHLLAKEAMQLYKRTNSREVQIRSEMISRIHRQIEQAGVYYLSAAGSANAEIVTKANLNLIDLLVSVASSSSSSPDSILGTSLFSQLNLDAQAAYSSLMRSGFDQLPMIDSLYGRLNLAKNLMAIVKSDRLGTAFGNALSLSTIEQLTADATALAEKTDNKRALSFSYGIAAELNAKQSVSTAEIETQYTQALSLSQAIQAFDISYDWAYKLAQLNESIGRNRRAAQYYEQALAALTQVREDLVAVKSELRFDFVDKVEPVYRDYLRFLVSREDVDFSQVVKTHESLQLAQLENFLRCGRLIASSPRTEDVATIHIVNLGDLIEVIVSRSNEVHGYSVPAEDVVRAAENLSLNLQSPFFIEVPEKDFLPYAKILYDKLMRPAVDGGLISSTEPLSFVLDTPFQTLPMGILHDGQQYLAATHPLSRSLQLRQLGSPSVRARALFVGLSEQAPSFSEPFAPGGIGPLPETEFEAESLKNYLRSTVLLNSAFTVNQLRDEMADKDYQIVHISTHGQFSSVPERTFLLAWDGLIDVQKMAQTFQGAGNIDLLVLSACQTAAGDERSTLGLAGLAVQSGARSAIASLWLVDSTGSSVLMDRFYQALHQGLPNAEALHQAQLTLMHSTTFSHPFYWAPFVLIGG